MVLTKNRSYSSKYLGNQLHSKYSMDVMAQYNKLGNTEQDLAVKNELAQSIVSRVEATGGRYLELDSKSSIILQKGSSRGSGRD